MEQSDCRLIHPLLIRQSSYKFNLCAQGLFWNRFLRWTGKTHFGFDYVYNKKYKQGILQI